MATYSRSQTISQTMNTQTTQSNTMPSMDISSLLVKSMENVMNDSEDKDDSKVPTDLSDVITKAINNSNLLKDKNENSINDLLKDKSDSDKKLSDLLKNKKDNDKELSDLLKNADKNKGDSTKEKKSTVKSDSDKASNGFGKIISGGIIGSAIAGIMGSKGILGGAKGMASGAVTGAGKVTGGLISGIGNLGGSAIAGVGKLFGPVGAMIGKVVGTAVAAPFKVVGGTITAAISGLGKLINMPLKELVTKGTLIVGVLSQLFVFLEGLLAKFIAQKDIKWIDFMSKLKSEISIIPDKLQLKLEQILSKVKIGGKPIFGSLTQAEEDELGNLGIRAKMGGGELGKKDPLYQYDQLLNNKKTGIVAKEAELQGIQDEMKDQFRRYTGGGNLDLSQYNLNTTAGKEALKADWLSNVSDSDKAIVAENIDSLLADYSYTSGSLSDAKKRAAYLEKTNPEIARYKELSEMANKPKDAAYFAEQESKLEEKQQQRQQDYFSQGLYDLSNKQVKDKNGNIVTRGLTAYEQNYAESLHQGSMAKVQNLHAEAGTQLTTKDATGAERFLQNQYKQWTDAWGKMFKDLKQDIGINITQKQDIPNPSYYNR